MRNSNWVQALSDYLHEQTGVAFGWGVADCFTFAAGASVAMGCDDWLAPHRGRYDSEAGARRIIDAAGGVQALLESLIGPELPTPRLAQRGDVVLCRLPVVGLCAGVSFGQFIAIRAATGFIRAPRSVSLAAWRVS